MNQTLAAMKLLYQGVNSMKKGQEVWDSTESKTIPMLVEMYTVTITYFSIGSQLKMFGLLEILWHLLP